MHVRLGRGPRAATSRSPPGSISRVGVAAHAIIELGEEVPLAPGTIALDGERELERTDEPATVRLIDGPLTIDVDAVMATSTQPSRA